MAKPPKKNLFGLSSTADATFARAERLRESGDVSKAEALYSEIIEKDPCHGRAANGLGRTLLARGALPDAEYMFAHAVAVDPRYVEAHVSRGRVLLAMQQPLKALASFDAALAIDASSSEAGLGRAEALFALERFTEAATAYDAWPASKTDGFNAHFQRSQAFRAVLRLDDAIASLERALAIEPDHALARLNKAQCHLAKGELETGWADFESRWRTNLRPPRKLDKPMWVGDADISGKTLLVACEEGFGDMIQLCRYVPLLPKDTRVVLEVPATLRSLMATLEGVDELCLHGQPLPAFDFYCMIMSLPFALRKTVGSVPARIPYLVPERDAIAIWRDKLGLSESLTASQAAPRPPRVGLAWSGRNTHPNDGHRSLPLENFGTLLSANATFFSLQKELRKRDRPYLDAHPELRYFGAELETFGDTAALVSLMDLVITVDTSIAHLAGAMGKPVWILVPFYRCDWRWMVEREDSPWYPTARLFRQDAHGWEPVLARVVEELGRLSSSTSAVGLTVDH